MQEEVFGRYTLVRRLAVGGMAEIFLASLRRDGGFEKKVVVKRILPHLGADDAFVKMFIDEAILAARLSHPNVIQVYDFGSVGGSHYIAMEYVEGVDLHRILRLCQNRGRRLTPAEVATIGEGVARGLAYTHGLADDGGVPLCIVHRDVSPHNIMISAAGEPKVMDFGIAKAAARATRTVTGTIKGKLAYMSPEQATGQPLDKRTDQFSLGVVLWECLTGVRLFAGDTEVNLIQKVIACDIPTVRSVRPDVPVRLEAAVMRALSKDPAARFADLHDLATELMEFRFALGGDGIVQLDELLKELAPPVDADGSRDWSWADHQAGPGATRPMAAPAHRDPTPRHPPLPGVLNAALTPPPALDPLRAGGSTPSHPMAVGVPGVSPANPPPTPAADSSIALGLEHVVPAPWVAPGLAPGLASGSDPGLAAMADVGSGRLPFTRPTARVRRPNRRQGWRADPRLAAASGALLMVLGIGLPIFLWTTAGDTATAVYRRDRQHYGIDVSLPTTRVGTGRLSLRTDGPSVDVYLGTQRLGATPLFATEVPAGKLKLRMVNEDAGIWRNLEIFIPEGGNAEALISSR